MRTGSSTICNLVRMPSTNPLWPTLTAVQAGRVVDVDDDPWYLNAGPTAASVVLAQLTDAIQGWVDEVGSTVDTASLRGVSAAGKALRSRTMHLFRCNEWAGAAGRPDQKT